MNARATHYRARYRATGARSLIGGVRESQSSVWAHLEDCAGYLESALSVNRGAGIPCEGAVEETAAPADILRHECAPGIFSPIAQARGCVCPTCHAIVPRLQARRRARVGVKRGK